VIKVRHAKERGRTRLEWLDSWHTFSFDTYHDTDFMNFGPLRVMNEDQIGPGRGFGFHPHRDMEILTYVLSGSLEHKDSLGTGSTIKPGELQRMSAGTGILHSEFNSSETEPLHLLQIWIIPNEMGIKPSYEQKEYLVNEGELGLIASGNPKGNELKVHQDVNVFIGKLKPGQALNHNLGADRLGWVQVTSGGIAIAGNELAKSDGAAISNESVLSIKAKEGAPAELIFFDLPANVN
jgi:redox-sensitive bicupin YhaK (pirin superfamily)